MTFSLRCGQENKIAGSRKWRAPAIGREGGTPISQVTETNEEVFSIRQARQALQLMGCRQVCHVEGHFRYRRKKEGPHRGRAEWRHGLTRSWNAISHICENGISGWNREKQPDAFGWAQSLVRSNWSVEKKCLKRKAGIRNRHHAGAGGQSALGYRQPVPPAAQRFTSDAILAPTGSLNSGPKA